EEHGGHGRIELVTVVKDRLVGDPARAGNRALPEEVLEPGVDQRQASLYVVDQLELAHSLDPGRELDRLDRAPRAVDLEHPPAGRARDLAGVLPLWKPLQVGA